MNLDRASVIAAIKAEILRIAAGLDSDASDLLDEEIIPASGTIDSAGLLELIAWFESAYEFRVPPEDFTVDKLGSMASMADYLRSRKGVA